MVCYSPLKVYRSRKRNPETGKFPILFKPSSKHTYSDIDGFLIPCGRCPGCLQKRAFHWSLRCVCETYSFDESYFLTLTYDDEHIPSGRNLNRADFQSFMKRLRWHFRNYKLKVFYCGEYGERRHRPHYHAIIFGLPLRKEGLKLIRVSTSKRGNANYSNSVITNIWKKGAVVIGQCTPQSCSYVAQYTVKKLPTGANSNYIRFLKSKRVQPFVGASNRNAIGYDFFMKHYQEIYSSGFFNPFPPDKNNQRRWYRPPRYFDKLLEKHFPILYIKYIQIPKRIYFIKERLLRIRDKLLFAATLDKKLYERYIKEKCFLRKMQKSYLLSEF